MAAAAGVLPGVVPRRRCAEVRRVARGEHADDGVTESPGDRGEGRGDPLGVAVWTGASPARNVMVMTVDRCGIRVHLVAVFDVPEQHQQCVSQLDALIALPAAEGSQLLVLELETLN